MNDEVFGKTMETVRKHRIKENRLFIIRSKLSYHKVFHRKSVSNRNEKNSNIYNFINIRSSYVHVKTDDIYRRHLFILEYFETGFDRSNFEINRLLLKEKNKRSNCTNEK